MLTGWVGEGSDSRPWLTAALAEGWPGPLTPQISTSEKEAACKGGEGFDRPSSIEALGEGGRTASTLGAWEAEGNGEDMVRGTECNCSQQRPMTNRSRWGGE